MLVAVDANVLLTVDVDADVAVLVLDVLDVVDCVLLAADVDVAALVLEEELVAPPEGVVGAIAPPHKDKVAMVGCHGYLGKAQRGSKLTAVFDLLISFVCSKDYSNFFCLPKR